jgi:PTS system beta-glucosides-specific IIC component
MKMLQFWKAGIEMSFLKNLFNNKEMFEIGAPMAGKAVSVKEVNDPTFSEDILGKGMAIRPTDGKVFAPCDGEVDLIFETGHAVSMMTSFGAELLLHIGLDTVNLKGKHFTIHANIGDQVKKGDLLLEFDLAAVVADGYDPITPMIICNHHDFGTMELKIGNTVVPGDTVMAVAK